MLDGKIGCRFGFLTEALPEARPRKNPRAEPLPTQSVQASGPWLYKRAPCPLCQGSRQVDNVVKDSGGVIDFINIKNKPKKKVGGQLTVFPGCKSGAQSLESGNKAPDSITEP
jgi:hypothetical protein